MTGSDFLEGAFFSSHAAVWHYLFLDGNCRKKWGIIRSIMEVLKGEEVANLNSMILRICRGSIWRDFSRPGRQKMEWYDIPGSCSATETLLTELRHRYPGAIIIGNIGGSHIAERENFIAPFLNAVNVECYGTAPPVSWDQICSEEAPIAKFLNLLKLRDRYGTDVLLVGRGGHCPLSERWPVEDAALCCDAEEPPLPINSRIAVISIIRHD